MFKSLILLTVLTEGSTGLDSKNTIFPRLIFLPYLERIKSLHCPIGPARPAEEFQPLWEQWEALTSEGRRERQLSDKEVGRSHRAAADDSARDKGALFLSQESGDSPRGSRSQPSPPCSEYRREYGQHVPLGWSCWRFLPVTRQGFFFFL